MEERTLREVGVDVDDEVDVGADVDVVVVVGVVVVVVVVVEVVLEEGANWYVVFWRSTLEVDGRHGSKGWGVWSRVSFGISYGLRKMF